MTGPDELLTQLGQAIQATSARMDNMTAPKRCEYKQVRWEKVNELARDGWQLQQAVGTWGPEDGHVTVYIMVRPLGVADEAAELLNGRPDAG